MSADLPIGGMASFLKALISEGNARVTSEPAPPMDAEARRLLVQSEASARLELAGEAPDFRLDVGDWSAAILYASCRRRGLADPTLAGEEHHPRERLPVGIRRLVGAARPPRQRDSTRFFKSLRAVSMITRSALRLSMPSTGILRSTTSL